MVVGGNARVSLQVGKEGRRQMAARVGVGEDGWRWTSNLGAAFDDGERWSSVEVLARYWPSVGGLWSF